MPAEYRKTHEFRGASFTQADFAGATFRDCDLSRVKIADSWLIDVDLAGEIGAFLVNGVDVTDFVSAELDRRHPERVQMREMPRTPDGYRAMWDTVERIWAETVTRAEQLPEAARHEQVNGEWSFTETLRHLVYATDAWASRTVLDEPMPYHRLGLPQTSYPPADAAELGMDIGARPSFVEVFEARADRMAVVRRIVDGLTEAELERMCSRTPAPGYPEKQHSVGACLRVVMVEECEHHRYALRDLGVLEARQTG